MCTIASVLPARSATYLGPSTKTRSSSSDSDSKASSYTYSNSDDDDDTEVQEGVSGGSYSPFSLTDVPTNWIPARFRASAEFGLLYWEPFSKSGSYDTRYDIEPVFATIFETTVRAKSWIFALDYTTSLDDPDQIRNLMGQVSRINPGAGAWWSLFAESGWVEGEASTEDQFGNPVVYPVDTEWNRIGIECNTYDGFAVGLIYEDLTLPTILTFNNEAVAFAIFDEDARARTLSLSLGYDHACKLLNSFKEGGAWAWALEGSLGMGWLSYSKDESRRIIENQGYDFNSNPLLFAGALDGRLGYTYSKTIWGNDVQCFAGARLRASGWLNLASEEEEEGAVGLETGFGLIMPGIFARFSFQW
ncbi:hypothetical protein P4B35_16480 [Pontiellaceae bacterium B12227]|nr:hypothetical protein [Pontiellaceae bacterium B12227]